MAVSIGGIQIGVGVDVSHLLDGFNAAKANIETFRKDIAKIRVEGLVKGDPFSATRKHLSKTREAINDVFKSWATAMKDTTKDINKFAALSKKSTEKIMKDWAKLGGKRKIELASELTTFANLKEKFGFGEVAGRAPKGGRAMWQWFSSADISELNKYIQKWKRATPEVAKALQDFSNRFTSGIKTSKKNAEAEFKKLYNTLKGARQRVVNEYKGFGEDLRKAQLRQTRIEWAAKGAEARSPEALMKRRREALLKLTVAYRRYYLEREKGYNVEAMNEAIGKNLLARQRWGAKLTKEQTKELKRYNKELAKQKAGEYLFSKQWMLNRARWFVQLRLFWSIYRNTIEAIKDLVDYQYQLARAMRTAQSETMTTTRVTEAYADAMKSAVVIHGVGWKDVGEALYQLGSAGLTAEESLAALDSTMSLIVGTEGDVRDVTKAVAGIYNNFADTITHVNTIQEKFQYINNVIAATWKSHQVEIEELTMGYKRASMMADKVGVNFLELTSMLGVLNDHMIKGGRAGRSLVSVWSRMSRGIHEFSREFNIAIDPNKPLDFMDIMTRLSAKLSKGKTSVFEVAAAFERLGLRGAPTFITLIKNWDEVSEAMADISRDSDALAKNEETLLDTISGRWKQFLGGLRVYVTEAEGIISYLKDVLKEGADWFESKHMQRVEQRLIGLAKTRPLGAVNIATGKPNQFLRDEIRLLSVREKIALKEDAILYSREGGWGWTKKEIEYWKAILEILDDIEIATKKKKKEEATTLKITETLAEKKVRMADTNLAIEERILIAEELLAKATQKVEDREADLNRERAKAIPIYANIVGNAKLLEEAMKERIALERTLARLRKEWSGPATKQTIESLQMQKEDLDYENKQLQAESDRYALKGVTSDEEEKMLAISKRQYEIAVKQLELELRISRIKGEGVLETGKKALRGVEEARAAKLLRDEKIHNQAIAELKRQQTIETNKLLIAKDKEISLAKIGNAEAIEILKLEKDRLDIRLKDLDIVEELVKKDADAVDRIHNKRRRIEIEITENLEKQRRAMHPLYDAYKKIEASVKSVNEFISDITVQTARGIAGGLTDIVYDLTGGFQEQQQEAENLKGRLAELNKEYNNLFEEDEGRAKEITEEMARLRKEIDDLEDPIHNLKEAFKDFFKDLIDQIRKAIIQWIALRAVQAGMSWAGFNIGGNAGGVSPGDLGYANWGGWTLPKKTGGILPEIKAFKQFSSGGITSRPTLLALAGDNKSGRELIIPEENIKSDEVSGYVREGGGDIYIGNFITEGDLLAATAGANGKRVVINHVLEDIDNQGPVWQRIGGR